MQNYPIFMDLKQQPCLVVGGGEVALRKIRLMSAAGARITVVAPEICPDLRAEFGSEIEHLQREFTDSDVHGYRLVTAATNDHIVNAQVSKLAQAANVPVNVVDQPHLCSFITPAIIDRSPVMVAISTGGAAPVLARFLRGKIESLVPASYGRLAAAMASVRELVKKRIPDETQRRRFWERIVQGPIVERMLLNNMRQASAEINRQLEQYVNQEPRGEVWLIGAGPGDPDLLTFRALRLMQQAEIVLYDRLVSEQVLDLCRRDAERIYVGKQRSEHAVSQKKINQMLLELASEGKLVARLKGGDPFIFGRGGEEIELLADAGIPFQIVPGITAASGCASYAGIPLTHRDHAQSCYFVTGHLKDGTVDLDWQRLAAANQTIVVYMGLVGLPTICNELIRHGLPATTPLALIEQGTTARQRVFTGTLESMPEKIAKQEIHAPTLIIIGSVVSLHDNLSWLPDHTEADA